MRRGGWVAAGAGGVAALLLGARLLLAPAPPPSDLPGFALASTGLLLLVVAVALHARERARGLLGAERARAWRLAHYLAGGYAGLVLAALVLAYKDNGTTEWRALATPLGALDVFAQALIAPLAVLLGALVGYLDPQAPFYVLACVAAGLLGARVLRRRTWPRRLEARQGAAADARAR